MPSIFRKLEWLDKEDIIKRMVSLEFNRMIDYYKDADEIEVVDEHAPRERRRGNEPEKGFVRFFLNFGKTDGLFAAQLIELINRCVTGRVQIGRIDLRDNFSFFEIEEKEAKRVMDSMNGYEVDGRRISVEIAQTKKDEKGKGKSGRGSRFETRSRRSKNDEKPWRRTTAERNERKRKKRSR